jgi:cytolysin-activating lysine-acyltransferase
VTDKQTQSKKTGSQPGKKNGGGKPQAASTSQRGTKPQASAKTQGQSSGKSQASPKPQAGGQGQTIASVIGEVVYLLAQSAQHRNNVLVGDLEWYLLPAVSNGQVRLFHDNGRPVGFAVWAHVSGEIEDRLKNGGYKLRASDWRSGPKTWLVDVVAPFGGAEKMLEELGKSALADRHFSFVRVAPEGKREVVAMAGEKASGSQTAKRAAG